MVSASQAEHYSAFGFGLGRPLFLPVKELRQRSLTRGSPSGPVRDALGFFGPAPAPVGLAPANFFGALGRKGRSERSPPAAGRGRSPKERGPPAGRPALRLKAGRLLEPSAPCGRGRKGRSPAGGREPPGRGPVGRGPLGRGRSKLRPPSRGPLERVLSRGASATGSILNPGVLVGT